MRVSITYSALVAPLQPIGGLYGSSEALGYGAAMFAMVGMVSRWVAPLLDWMALLLGCLVRDGVVFVVFLLLRFGMGSGLLTVTCAAAFSIDGGGSEVGIGNSVGDAVC